MADENEVYACCPECSNDYKLQVIGKDYSGTDYICPECYTEFTVDKDGNTTNITP